jgi:hypothetical protein
MEIESLYVGRPPGVVNIPWYEYPDLTPNPNAFVRAVEREAGAKDAPGAADLPQRQAHRGRRPKRWRPPALPTWRTWCTALRAT